MDNPRDIIIAPVVTEKSTMQAAEGVYTFKVRKNATKPQIAKAIEQIFNVRVLDVNTINYKGKPKRRGMTKGYTASGKKAYVRIDTDPQPASYFEKGGKPVKSSKKLKGEIAEFGFGH